MLGKKAERLQLASFCIEGSGSEERLFPGSSGWELLMCKEKEELHLTS